MASILDQTADTQGVELSKFAQLYEFPGFVKQSDIRQAMAPGYLERTAYADYFNKEFPCHTKAATWVSALYFFEKRGTLDPKQAEQVEQRLSDFANYHRIKNAYDSLKQQHEELHKEAALNDDDYAYVWESENGQLERRCPLRNNLEVKTAAEWFQEYRDHWLFSDRQKIATRILKKADALGVRFEPLTELFLQRQSGRGVPQPKEVVAMIHNRARLIDHPDFKQQVLKLAEVVETTPQFALGPDNLEKLAATIDTIDRYTGIVRKYSSAVPRPEDVLFRVTYKEAQAAVDDSCTLTTGSIYNKQAFGALKLNDVGDLFGDDFAREVSSGVSVDPEKMAELAHTLPMGEAEMLDRLMSAHGQSPMGKQAAMAKTGFSKEQLQGMASLYN